MSDAGEPVLAVAQAYEAARERRHQGNILGAVARYRKAAELAEQRGDLRWGAEILTELGEMHQEAYDLLEARRSYEEALECSTRAGETVAGARVQRRLAEVAQLSGDPTGAETGFRAAAQAYRANGDRATEGETRLALAGLLWELQRPDDAVEEAARAWSLGRESRVEELPAEAVKLLRLWKRRVKPEWLRERLAGVSIGGAGLWKMLE